MPFDNAQKRISLTEGQDHLSGSTPAEFFRNFLRDGTGGMCWPSSAAFLALARHLGFAARAAVCAMQWADRQPGHATVLVRLDGEDLMCDTSMLFERPFLLRRGEPNAVDDALHPVHAVPHGDLWIVWWASYGSAAWIPCVFLADGIDGDELTRRYEATRRNASSGFNRWFSARTNVPAGVRSWMAGTLSSKDSAGLITKRAAGREELMDLFGFREELVARIPADEAEAPSAGA